MRYKIIYLLPAKGSTEDFRYLLYIMDLDEQIVIYPNSYIDFPKEASVERYDNFPDIYKVVYMNSISDVIAEFPQLFL